MNPQRSATLAAVFYPTVVIAGWAIVNLAGMPSPPRIETSAAVRVVDRFAPALAASIEHAAAPRTAEVPAPQLAAAAAPEIITMSYAASGNANGAAAEFIARPVADAVPLPDATPADAAPLPGATSADAAPVADEKPVADAMPVEPTAQPIVVAALTDPAEVLSPEVALAPPADTAATSAQDAARTARRIEIVGECIVVEPCIDQYLFALYQRTPKEDSIKETEKRKVSVKRKGKMVTVTRSFTRLVENDFTWKDPKAAERVGMSMSDYVIGGMDRSFKLKLFQMLYAAESAGLQPGITSAFRDDYRQSIAAGLKAASDRSYHGGSTRGGYGHGLAADIVSVNGANRAQRWTSTEAFWKWVDANGKQFGIGRPYLGRDPPHVGPIDGQEYVSKRGGTRVASADVRKRDRHASRATAARAPAAHAPVAHAHVAQAQVARAQVARAQVARAQVARAQIAQAKPPAAKRPVVARSSKGRTI